MPGGPPPLGGSPGLATDGLLRGDAPGRPPPQLAAAETRRLGSDLDLPLDTDAPLPMTVSGDLRLISGRANTHRALLRRVLVAPGALLHRPDYGGGLSISVSLPDSTTTRSRLANDGRRNVLADPRVADARVAVGGSSTTPGRLTVGLSVKLRGDDTEQKLGPLTIG